MGKSFACHSKILLFLIIDISCVILYTTFFYKSPIKYVNRYIDISEKTDVSCLNDIYDEIFVISIQQRMDTLSITLFQLDEENITYTIWNGHSINQTHSNHLWHQFRQIVNDQINSTLKRHMQIIKNVDNAYHNKHIFFLRQTQIDIIKYAQKNNLSKILIIEDDILLANPFYINMFCETESSLMPWYILNLGINQEISKRKQIQLLNIENFENYEMKYMIKTKRSYGTYAISISNKMYPILINLFDFQLDCIHCTNQIKASYLYPLDNYFVFVNDEIKKKCFNIHPTLFLPDVTHSSIRENRSQLDFIETRTIDHNIFHFSKYWPLRFNSWIWLYQPKDNSAKTKKIFISILICKTISFYDINETLIDIDSMSLIFFNETHYTMTHWILFIWENKTYTKIKELLFDTRIDSSVKLIYHKDELKHFFWQTYLKPNMMMNNFDYVWLMDGDISINQMNWNCFWYNVDIIYKPSIFQPSILYPNDYYPNKTERFFRTALYPINQQEICNNANNNMMDTLFGIEVAFIEIQTAIFTFSAWKVFITELNDKFKNVHSKSDWGPDKFWCNLINEKLLHQSRNMVFNKEKRHKWNDSICNVEYSTHNSNDIPCMIIHGMQIKHFDTKTHPVHNDTLKYIHRKQMREMKALFKQYWVNWIDYSTYYRAFPIQKANNISCCKSNCD